MKMKFKSVLPTFLLSICLFTLFGKSIARGINEKYLQKLEDGKIKTYDLGLSKQRAINVAAGGRSLGMFCYEGVQRKSLSKLFTTTSAKISTVGESLEVYKGQNETEAFAQHESARQSWLSWATRHAFMDTVTMDTFNRTCVLIDTSQQYSVQLIIKPVDPLLLALLLSGLVLFYIAPYLCRNTVFLYSSGVSLGVLLSTLIILITVTRFLPKKSSLMTMFWLGGGSMVMFLWKHVYDNLQPLLETHMHWVLGYFGASALISFAYCYYWGTPSDPRKLNIIQWGIQLVACIMIICSSQMYEVTIAILLVTLALYKFPFSLCSCLCNYWRRKFPPKIKLLTMDEFDMQGQEETRKALEELKEFCRSPDCDAWRTISRLKDPHKFAQWIEGDSRHVSDDEFAFYSSSGVSLTFPGHELETSDEDDFALSAI